MKNDNANSGPSSAATSAAATPIRPDPSPADEAKAVSKAGVGEAAYLRRQEQLAKQAITHALADVLALGKNAADPHRAMKAHPWATLAASAAAGFAAAAVAVPSKEQQALRKLARLERMLNPEPPRTTNGTNGHASPSDGHTESGERAYKSGKSSLSRAIIGELIGALKPAIVSLLTAGVTGAVAKPSDEEIQAAATGADPSAS